MFSRAIVRKPCKKFRKGLTTSNFGLPVYEIAISQHLRYVNALKKCGLELIILDPDENFPDSTFVEDTAVVNEKVAIITNPGAKTRKGEEIVINQVLEKFYENIEFINDPGTLDGGDIMRIENHYYIGISQRTNVEGARQLTTFLKKHGFKCSNVNLINFLHLKSGINYIGDNNLLVSGEFTENRIFENYNRIKVREDEIYAANCVRINDFILLPKGYDKTIKSISRLGYNIIELEMSEFKKMDGGLSCLSIRF
jgi:dimethylargininase